MVRNLRQWTTLLIWEATLVPWTVFRRISQLELTKQETVIAAFVTYGNQTYIAWRQNFNSLTVTSYQYYYMDVKAGVSRDDMNKHDVFQTKCLRRTYNIFWPNKISNEDQHRRTNSSPISTRYRSTDWDGWAMFYECHKILSQKLLWDGRQQENVIEVVQRLHGEEP